MFAATAALSTRRSRREAASSFSTVGYNLAAVISAIRSDPAYGSHWTDTSDPWAPNGLQAPTEPTITSSVTVSSLAALAAAITNGVRITLDPGNYTVASAVPAIDIGAFNDVHIIATGCTFTCNKTVVGGGLRIEYRANRIKVTGGNFDAGYDINGYDWMLENCNFTVATGETLNANTGLVSGIRGAWVHCTSIMFDGGPLWVNSARHALISGTISGTTLNVTSHNGRPLQVGMYLDFQFSTGTATLQNTYITGFGTGTGGTGTYTVNRSQNTTASCNWFAVSRSTNIILANSIGSATIGTGASAGTHENMCRFNGTHFGLEVDSRVVSQAGGGGAKPTLRATSNTTIGARCGTIGAIRVQAEGSGFQTPNFQGHYPNCDKLIVDACEIYRTPISVATNGGPALDPQPIATIFVNNSGDPAEAGTSISGNGTTATISTRSSEQLGHGLVNGDTPDISCPGAPAFNATNAAITVVDPHTFTYPSSATGSATSLTINTKKPNLSFFFMRNTNVYSAPDVGVNGAGWTGPSGVDPSWTTVSDASAAAANGNFYRTWVAPPAWAFR